jgi:thiol-disulfide isomerase/thioredoxin
LNASFRNARRLACGAALALALSAQAAPRSVEAFDKATWQAMQSSIKQPTVVVFTATWCSTCPQVMDALVAEVRQRKLKAQVVAVVMDVAPGEKDAALMRNDHYHHADRLFAFDGQAAAIRDKVDPKWRGAAPYVALLSPQAKPRMSVGMPAAADLAAWAAAKR